MKNLQLTSMLLVSHREKKARKIEFDPKVTVIQGANDTGKSSLIKSIPYVFGANPHKRHQKWKDADVAILVRFKLDRNEYSLYRHRNSFSLFDTNDKKMGTYSSVTLELAPVLAKLFDFNLRLSDREGVPITPPPAYLMLPFYLDQDKGWVDTWSSFTNLSQFAYWKQRVSGYHYGLKPDKWYELEAKKKKLEGDKDEPERQVEAIKSVREKTYNELSRVDFDIDIERFRKEIDQLLDKCDSLKSLESKYRKKTTELRTEKIRLVAQIEIVAKTHDELSEDYKFSCQTEAESIGCPTCGAHYQNSFAERFEIAQDTETCTDLLASLREDLGKVERDISQVQQLLSETKNDIQKINSILSKKQGKVKLKDLIDLEGKKSLIAHLDKESEAYRVELSELDNEIYDLSQDMERFDDPERRKEIISDYGEILRRYTMKLGVFSLSDNVYKNINTSIEESGSDLPRAILAYFYTTLDAIKKNGNSTYFPIIIDAPNQQEQDPDNLKKMLDFISDNRPDEAQLIIGLVDDADVDFNGKIISLDKKYSVLEEGYYLDAVNEIRYYETANLEIGV